MAVALKEDHQRALDEQKQEVRELVMAGLEQTFQSGMNWTVTNAGMGIQITATR